MSQDRALPRERNHALDGLRGLAALAVALGHCVLAVTGPDTWGLVLSGLPGRASAEIVGRLAYLAFPSDAAVTLFFVLSGHVLWDSFGAKYPPSLRAFPEYASARLYRLLPVAIVGAIPLGLLAGRLAPAIDGRELAETMLFLSLRTNGVLWSLQVEIVCSLALFLVWMVVRDSLARLVAAAIACFVLYRLTKDAYLLFAISFVAGALLGRMPPRLAGRVSLLILGLVLLVGTSLVIGHGWRSRYGETLGAVLIVAWVRVRRPAVLTSAPVHLLGRISYPFYLTHIVGMQLAAPLVTAAGGGPALGFAIYATVSIALTIPLAFAIHVGVEMPAMRGRPRLPVGGWPRHPAAAEAPRPDAAARVA